MPKEIERRFLITKLSPSFEPLPEVHHITQGYTSRVEGGARIRSVNNTNHFLTIKQGRGLVRDEVEMRIPQDTARNLLDLCPFKLSKTRYKRDGWEIDFLEGSLKGIILAEKEMRDANEKVVLPAWIGEGVEVTDSVTNLHLATMAFDLEHSNESVRPVDLVQRSRALRIVLTGAPCSGKTSVLKEITQRKINKELHIVPEVASILISQVGIRPSKEKPLLNLRFQQTLYRVQRAFEELADEQAALLGKRAVLLDRGTLDGAAFFPGGVGEFCSALTTTKQAELRRYDAVLLMHLPDRNIYQANAQNNPARSESFEEARHIETLLCDEAWSGHPKLVGIWPKETLSQRVDDIVLTLAKFFYL